MWGVGLECVMPAELTKTPFLFERWPPVNVSASPAPPTEGAFKSLMKSAVLGVYKHSGLMRFQEAVRAATRPPFMTILLFHRVTDRISPDGLTVGTEWFQNFCRLMKSKYHVVTLDEIDRCLREGVKPRRRTVAITFDDCYADNHQAARILHEHGLPATFFVPTAYVGTDRRFPWDAHLPNMPNLTWDEIRQMAGWGHTIGSHTVSHADLGKLSDDEARREMVDSRRELERQLDRPAYWFAFPYGGRENFRHEQFPLVLESGYRGCLSAMGGFVEMSMAGEVLPREAVPYFRNLTQLELHVNRCLDWVYAAKRRFGVL